MIVVDTNILAYLYLPGEYTSLAEESPANLFSCQADCPAHQDGRS